MFVLGFDLVRSDCQQGQAKIRIGLEKGGEPLAVEGADIDAGHRHCGAEGRVLSFDAAQQVAGAEKADDLALAVWHEVVKLDHAPGDNVQIFEVIALLKDQAVLRDFVVARQ